MKNEGFAVAVDRNTQRGWFFLCETAITRLCGGSKCFILHFLFFILFIPLLTSCGVDSGKFRIEGRLRNMNVGEFWVYSPDGGIDGIDTIPVREGRFSYETDLRNPATFIVIFPNYSEIPVFGESGTGVTIKGDASHLKEIEVKGTDDNEEMTKLRMTINRSMPPEIPGVVEEFIREHPQSIISNYLVQRYFVFDAKPDFRKAAELLTLMVKAQPANARLEEMQKRLAILRNGQPDSRLPVFSATDVWGRKVTQDQLKSKLNVVAVWASWNFQSTDMMYRLQRDKQKYGSQLGVVAICLDARPQDVKRRLERDTVRWQTVCDGRVWQTPLLATLGLEDVPANLVINDRGVIVERNMKPQDLDDKIKQILK